MARQKGTPKRKARSEADHAPAPGIGMAMSVIKNTAPISSNFLEWRLRVKSKILLKNHLNTLKCFIKKVETGPNNMRLKKIGTILPMIPQKSAPSIGRPRNTPVGTATFNSNTGSMAMSIVIISGGRVMEDFDVCVDYSG